MPQHVPLVVNDREQMIMEESETDDVVDSSLRLAFCQTPAFTEKFFMPTVPTVVPITNGGGTTTIPNHTIPCLRLTNDDTFLTVQGR